ncbi:MAG TPA: N-acetylmuramoyl-L-alanine amidase [Prolixibacteraceae bacterium]|nr:N-acetylmuramoyl-L-alanine amidase [Prolixibacteraceae bacterium]
MDKSNARPLIVVIDPGHGGKDPGAVNKAIREKDIVLSIGLKLGKLINENHPDVKVIYTRSTDVFIPLIDRSRIANRNKADLFISIHANACPTPSIRGTETFFLGPSNSDATRQLEQLENSVIFLEEDYKTTYDGFDPNSAESYIIFENVLSAYADQSLYFADAIQQQFKSRIQSPNRGVKQAGFLVLRQSTMPSVLVEAGFVSNQAEAKYLNSDEGQQQVAVSIFEAFKKFKGKRTGTPVSSNQDLASIQKVSETIPVPVKEKDTVVAEKNLEVKEVVAEKSEDAKDEVADKKAEQKKPIAEKAEEIKNEVSITPAVLDVKEPEKAVNTLNTDPVAKQNTKEIYYSVQIGANTSPVEPVAGNFKGLKNIRRDKTDKFYRYYVGKESSLNDIAPLLKQVKLKFPQAFIVSFVDGQRVPLNVGTK